MKELWSNFLDFWNPTRVLVRTIKARGHWLTNMQTGESTWVPGTWKTPPGNLQIIDGRRVITPIKPENDDR